MMLPNMRRDLGRGGVPTLMVGPLKLKYVSSLPYEASKHEEAILAQGICFYYSPYETTEHEEAI